MESFSLVDLSLRESGVLILRVAIISYYVRKYHFILWKGGLQLAGHLVSIFESENESEKDRVSNPFQFQE